MSDQDWTTVTISKTKATKTTQGLSQAQLNQAKVSGAVETQKKFAAGENKSSHHASGNMKKLEVILLLTIILSKIFN